MKKNKDVRTTIRLNKELYEAIRFTAYLENTSVNKLILKSLSKYMEKKK